MRKAARPIASELNELKCFEGGPVPSSATVWLADIIDQNNLSVRKPGGVDLANSPDDTDRQQTNRAACDFLLHQWEMAPHEALILNGEYGCYRSHLKALADFLETGQPIGIIVEDDIELSSDLLVRTQAAFEVLPSADVIKLCNHRTVWFKTFATSSFGDEIGRAGHGPQGSAACYAVTRAGASKLIQCLQRMKYPWDVALERGWAMKADIYATRQNVVAPGRHGTTIASRSVYRGTKFKWWRRLKAYADRTLESARRLRYTFCS